MSSIVTRPRLPVAGTSLRSTPLSLAYFLTLGMANNLISTSDELFCFSTGLIVSAAVLSSTSADFCSSCTSTF